MKIGIAGAGIGGLAAAALLAADGHSVEVFDQFDAPRPIGSGLVIQPVGQEVLRACGAEGAIALGHPIHAMEGYEVHNGRRVLGVRYGTEPDRWGLGIHRAALHQSLLTAAQSAGVRLHASHRVMDRDGQCLVFADGRSDPFDLLIDAAGAASTLSPLIGKPLPYGAVWATVAWPKGHAAPDGQLIQRYVRANRMLGILPVGRMPDDPGTELAAIFYSLPADGEATWRAQPLADWRAEAGALWPEFDQFLAPAMTHADFTFASYSHGSLRRPYDTGLVHIGDAAHRASPQLGQGANMALLDARALQLALRRASGPEALRLYAGARRWHLAVYQALSASFTPQYQSDSTLLPLLRDFVLAPLSQTYPFPGILTKLVCGDLVPTMPALTPKRPG